MASSPAADRDGVVERAPAKLNLALHVRHRRADGYHELETLFAFCRDGDVVSVMPARDDQLAIVGPFAPALANEGDNLVTRAAAAFAARFGQRGGVAITLEKRLPVASGLGGGSADAAATLRALARLEGVAHDDPALVAVAERLGADVPACLAGRTAFGAGVGERLTPLAALTGTPAVLVNPGVAVSTAAVFAGWDGIDRGPIGAGAPLVQAAGGRNDLTAAAITLAPAIGDALALLEAAAGATLVRMSGSGATCFALFGSGAEAAVAAAAIHAARPGWWCLETALA